MAESLLNSKNPVALFHKIWAEYALWPFIEANRRMREENYRKERAVIERLDRERAQAWYRRDVRCGLLSAA